jgi:hypothetical protein
MNQLTIRGFSDELRERIARLAADRDISLNKAALVLLMEGAGIGKSRESSRRIGTALDHLIGTWSGEEERDFLASVEGCEAIDEELWR